MYPCSFTGFSVITSVQQKLHDQDMKPRVMWSIQSNHSFLLVQQNQRKAAPHCYRHVGSYSDKANAVSVCTTMWPRADLQRVWMQQEGWHWRHYLRTFTKNDQIIEQNGCRPGFLNKRRSVILQISYTWSFTPSINASQWCQQINTFPTCEQISPSVKKKKKTICKSRIILWLCSRCRFAS